MKQGFKIIDSDIHVIEPAELWLRYIDAAFRDQAPTSPDPNRGVPWDWEVMGRPIPAYFDRQERGENYAIRVSRAEERFEELGREQPRSAGTSAVEMLKAMDTEGIDLAVVFRTRAAHVIGIDEMDPRLADAICRAYNNWLRDYCAADRARLLPAAQVASHDVDLAVQEARRAVRDLGAVALILPSWLVQHRPWYDPYYDPLWAVAQELDVPVAFHGIQVAYQEHVGKRYLDNFALVHAVAHPVEMMMALGAMLMGGVFERFPRLRGAFLEAHCSWVPAWLYALDERWEKFGNVMRFGLTMMPSDYFKRQCYVSVDPDETLVVDVVRAIGDENIVISTDWPHDDSSYPQAIDTFLAIEGLSDESRRKILWDNCARLYNVPVSAAA